MKNRILAAFVAATLFLVPATTIEAQSAVALAVDCDATAPGVRTLQEAMDQAAPGTEIHVGGLCDDGPYTIRGKSLSLVGNGATVLSSPSQVVLAVAGARVELRDLIVEGSSTVDGILLGGSSLRMDRVTVRHAARGVRIGLTSHGEFHNCLFEDNPGFAGAVVVAESSSLFMRGSTLRGNRVVGVRVLRNSSGILESNLIEDNGTGVLVDEMSSIALVGNVIEANLDFGVDIGPVYGVVTDPNTLFGNRIEDNGTDVRCGPKGIFNSLTAQISSTKIADLDPDCTVIGTVF